MSDAQQQDSAVWWRVNSRLETSNIYMFGFHLSPRMLLLTLLSLLVGVVVAAPLHALAYKGAVIGIFTLAGFMVSSKRAKMTPLELIILYRLTGYRTRMMPAAAPSSSKPGPKKEEGVVVDMLPIEDFTKPTPYNMQGRLRVARPTKLTLFLDSRPLGEYQVTPSSSQYWFIYKPEAKDIGTHDLIIRAEGTAKPVFQRTVAVFPRGKEVLLEQVKKQ